MDEDQPFLLTEILEESLYYPASGFQGAPIEYLAGNFLSFVYADYGQERHEFLEKLINPGFMGYRNSMLRVVNEDELSPQNPIPNPWELNLLHDDGDPRKHENDIKPFFCYWAIFQRCANRSAHHGPDRFSLLYICADGVAVFRSLYIQNAIVPKAIAIIQPGHGFGGNWTNFEDHEKVLGRSVLNDNLGGGPEFLLNGGAGGRGLSNDCNCWPDYKIPQAVNDDGSNFLGNTGISIWKNINMLCTCNNILV